MNKVTTVQDNEEFFELSAQYSDMVEKIISITDEIDLNEVMELVDKKIRQEEKNG